jgi:hypothetical protein
LEIEQVEPLGAVHRGGKEARLGGGEVEQGPGDGRDWDPVDVGPVLGAQSSRAVDTEIGALVSRRRGGHVDARPPMLRQAPEPGSSMVTQQRVLTAGEYCPKAESVARDRGMPNRVDTPVDLVQETRSRFSRDGRGGVPQVRELVRRDDPMLSYGKRRDRSVSSRFVPHNGNKGEFAKVLPPGTCVRLVRMVRSGRF